MADLNTIRIDIEKSNEGLWTDTPFGDIELLIGRQGSPRFNEFIQIEAQNPGDDREKTQEEERKHTNWVYANTILLGWRNLQIDGKDIPYSVKKALEFFEDDELVDLRILVIQKAADSARYRKEALDKAAKN